MKITVFTPTFNRGYIIGKLYESLKKQTYRDFEWVVIDDGSTDDTQERFQQFLTAANDFPITYQITKNGGKHRAINKGIKIAHGELFFIVDSDDFLPSDALERIAEVEQSIPEKDKSGFAGVCGVKSYPSGQNVGSTFVGKFLDITTLEREKYHIEGDKAEVFYTGILRKYPFPEFPGENFVTECVVWDKIAFDGYKLRFFNETVYLCDYLPDGLTQNYGKLYCANPRSYGLYIHQCIKFGKLTRGGAKREYRVYLDTHRKEYSLWTLARYLHTNILKLLPYEFRRRDIRHLPNRILLKVLGQTRYEKIKGKVGGK